MPSPQEIIDQYAALQGSGSQIPGIVREGNSFSAAPGSQLAGDLSSVEARRPAPLQAAAGSQRSYDAVALGQPPPNPDAGSVWRSMGVDRIAEAQKPKPVAPVPGDSGAIVRDGNTFRQAPPGPGSNATASPGEAAPAAVSPGITDKPARGVFSETGTAAPAPGALLRDGFGNATGPTQALQGQLERLRAENAAISQAQQPAERAPGTSYAEQQQAAADRFTRFVNESSTASLLHDLGKGGGTARTNAGMIAALNNAQQRDAAAQSSELQRSANVIAANTTRRAQDAQTKGQQLEHETALAQILGSPAQQQGQMLDAAIKSGQLDANNVLQSLQQKLIEAAKNKDTDGQARYALLLQQLQGKSPESKIVTFGGGQEIDPATGLLRTLSSRIAYTGQPPTIIEGQTRAPINPVPQIGDTIAGAKPGEYDYNGSRIRIGKDGKIESVGAGK